MPWQIGKERSPAEKKRRPPLILVIGLGNVLFQDDGVGVHLVRRFKEDPIPKILCAEVGTAVLGALNLMEWADKILAVDAMQAGGKPGTIYAFGGEGGNEPGFRNSLHEKALLSAFKFLSRKTPPEIRILGVEPETITFGPDLSPSVRASIPQGVQAIRRIVYDWVKPAGIQTTRPPRQIPGG